MPLELAQWIPPAVVITATLYLHDASRQDMARMERRLRQDVKELRGEIVGLRDRLGRVEEHLDADEKDSALLIPLLQFLESWSRHSHHPSQEVAVPNRPRSSSNRVSLPPFSTGHL